MGSAKLAEGAIFRARPERLELSMPVALGKGRPSSGTRLCNVNELIKGYCAKLQGRVQGGRRSGETRICELLMVSALIWV